MKICKLVFYSSLRGVVGLGGWERGRGVKEERARVSRQVEFCLGF